MRLLNNAELDIINGAQANNSPPFITYDLVCLPKMKSEIGLIHKMIGDKKMEVFVREYFASGKTLEDFISVFQKDSTACKKTESE